MDRETSRNLALGLTSTSLVIGLVVLATLAGTLAAICIGLIGLILIAGLSNETKR